MEYTIWLCGVCASDIKSDILNEVVGNGSYATLDQLIRFYMYEPCTNPTRGTQYVGHGHTYMLGRLQASQNPMATSQAFKTYSVLRTV
jgi:hypothetical protein